jgi:hypothetical protein
VARVEHFRETLSEPLTERYLKKRADEGWRLVAVEWQRETERARWEPEELWQEIPYGLRVTSDGQHLEWNPAEIRALELMLDLIKLDSSVSRIADELNRQGLRTRQGARWTQVIVFDLLPRLIEAAPQIRRNPPAAVPR